MIDPKIIEALNVFYEWAPMIDEWIIVKKNLLLMLPTELRSQFSRRDEKTKQQQPNELEFELMQRWAALTGKHVIFTNNGTQGKIYPP